MARAYSISFRETLSPIRDPITKFGGQPVWRQQPDWPISVSNGQQMIFICQILLYSEIFGEVRGRMAYVFIADFEQGMAATWDPDSGDNAVIIHPNGRPTRAPVRPLATGPTIFEYVEIPETGETRPRPVEFAVDVSRREDPDFVDEANRFAMEDAVFQRYERACEGNKIGGTPLFLQQDAIPPGGRLLLQLDSTKVPFYIRFGDCGVGWVFISPDGSAGKFCFQSY